MKNILTYAIGVIAIIALGVGVYAIHEKAPEVFGATANPGANALWENSLAQPLGTTDANMYVTSGADVQGNLLPVGSYQCFTVDIGQPNAEYICGSVSVSSTSGLTLAISLRGLSTATGTTTIPAQVFTHRRGADVRITDFPSLTILNNQLNGAQVIPNPILYSSNFTPSFWSSAASNTITTLGYVNSSVAAGCGAGSTIASGCFQAATALQAASSTVLGSTGFNDILLSSYATDTPTGTSASGSKVVMSLIGGYISQAWINLTQAFTFSGLVTFNTGGFIDNASSTFTVAPILSTLKSTLLKTNSVGQIVPAILGTDYLAPAYVITNTTATSTGTGSASGGSFSSSATSSLLTIPAGTLTGSSTIQIMAYGNSNISVSGGGGGSCVLSLQTLGGTNLGTISSAGLGNGAFTGTIILTFATSSIATETSVSTYNTISGLGGSNTVADVNFANAQTLMLSLTMSGSAPGGDTVTLSACTLTADTLKAQ